jgi:hypothetical protein
MHEEPTADTQNASDESQEYTEKLIGEINNLIARINRLRACIALYLVSKDLNDRKFPFRETSG